MLKCYWRVGGSWFCLFVFGVCLFGWFCFGLLFVLVLLLFGFGFVVLFCCVLFVTSCLYSAASLTRVPKWRFIRIIYLLLLLCLRVRVLHARANYELQSVTQKANKQIATCSFFSPNPPFPYNRHPFFPPSRRQLLPVQMQHRWRSAIDQPTAATAKHCMQASLSGTLHAKLRAMVYDILLPTTAITDYATGLEKL